MNKDLLAIFDKKAWNKKIFQFIYNDVCVPRYKTLCIYVAPKKLIKQFFKKKKETTFRVATQLIT